MNNEAFKKFCEQINFDITSNLLDSQILDVKLIEKKEKNKKVNHVTFFKISFFSIPSFNQLETFFQKTDNFFKPTNVEYDVQFLNKNFSKERIFDIISFGIKYIFKKDVKDFLNLENISYDIPFNKVTIEFDLISKYFNFVENIAIDRILSFFKINNDLEINIINKSEEQFINKNQEQEKIDEIEFIRLSKEKENQKNEKKSNSFLNRSKKYFKIDMTDFYSTHEQFVFVEGEIFEIETIVTKTNLKIVSVFLNDKNEAIVAKYFIRENEEDNFSWLTKNLRVSIFGEKKQEYNGNNYFLQINKIEEIKQNKIIDEASTKRIEFSTRTSMSSMDGFISAIDFMQHAKKIGHQAIAFTDFQNIQAFPEIYSNAKKIGIKPIYGCTFSVISKEHNLIKKMNKKDLELKNEKYVIFDLETTSLDPKSGEIIEFGAVVIENSIILETIQFFVKPSKPISKFTEELTGITQQMLDNEYKFDNQKDAILEILKIFDDYTLVAHNAQFDIGFIEEKLSQFNFRILKNQIIDTLNVAKFIFPISHSYRLEIVAKKMNVFYDPTIAHRANYDAKILQTIWSNMIEQLEQKKIITFNDLSNIDEPFLNEKKYGYDLAIYAKNQEGLKDLFKLVSLSLTKNYFAGPKLIEEELQKNKNLIIGPASINSRIIDLIQTGTSYELEKEIDKWDFIGVPCPSLFSHLISRGNFTEEELKIMIKNLVLKAKNKGKIIIAIGDVRYIKEDDSLAHSVYINTKGLEGKRHYLYRYNEINPKYPIQKFLTTNEMKNEFSFLNSENLIDEIVVKNTNYLNSLIEDNIEVIKTKLYPPKFDDSEKKLVDLVYKNAYKIYGKNLPKIVEDRIERELEPINKYGFSVVYWISQKLVSKSLSDGYLVGSRGSVGSSIVATLSGITEVNPLPPHYICKKCQYNEFVLNAKTSSGFDLPNKNCPKCSNSLSQEGQTIPFETFLGFDGDKVPDIDLNFSGDYQPIIHQEVRKIFGDKHSFRAGTIATVAKKTAYGFVKKYFEEQEVEKSNHFVDYLAKKIEGSKRTTGQHPGGIIIIPKEFDVEDFTPINYPANDLNSSWQTTHFDFHAIHDNVLKLDLLGHDDPTAIRQLQKLTKIKIEDISFSDNKVLELFYSTNPLNVKPEDINEEQTGVLGIPEFGTRFVRKMLQIAKPKSFNDLINISGLSHGTDVWNGNAEELIKKGKSLNEVISCRDDIMVYLMKKGIDSSFSFHIMEKVRKGKGLTKEEEEILQKNGIEKWYIDSLNKIKYMFPKAHATAYVMMAWRIAWFKIYYPLEFYATFFTVRSSVFDIENSLGTKTQIERKLKELEKKQFSKDPKNKISAKEEELIPIFEIINEMLARGFSISLIDLYISDAVEWKIDYKNKSLIPPFIVIDGLGETAAKSILKAREEKRFTSIEDFFKRTQVNKTVIEKMEKMNIISNLEKTDQLKLF